MFRTSVVVRVVAVLSACAFGFPTAAGAASTAPYQFSSFTFNSCGASGQNGPSLSDCRDAYAPAWIDSLDNFEVNGGIQVWTAPADGDYDILAAGARGGGSYMNGNGFGAKIGARVTLVKGQKLRILVGQPGTSASAGSSYGGGGGGSFVVASDGSPLVIAGGGGGGPTNYSANYAISTMNGQTGRTGAGTSWQQWQCVSYTNYYYYYCQSYGWVTQSANNGGSNGSGGSSYSGSGGGGLNGIGTAANGSGGGYSFNAGGIGGYGSTGSHAGDGGFGGGAGGGSSYGSGGGGGYSGGGGGGYNGAGAGGGGSYYPDAATNVTTGVSDVNNGYVTITRVPPVAPTVTTVLRNPTRVTSASIEFTGLEGSTFECSLDAAAFTPCTSPARYSSLADQEHSFRVRQIDVLGVTGEPTETKWVVDTVGPNAPSFTSAPPEVSGETSATFEFSGAEEGGKFYCAIDSFIFWTCTSGQDLVDLGLGSHTFKVRQYDAAGNAGAVAAKTWGVDITPPGVSSFLLATASPTRGTELRYTLGFDKPVNGLEASDLEVTGSASGWTVSSVAGSGAGPYTVILTGSESGPDGDVRLALKANSLRDTVGNLGPDRSAPAASAAIVDRTAPAAPTIAMLTPAPTNAAASTISFDAFTDKRFECSLDGAAFSECASPLTVSNVVEGTHRLTVRHFDPAGNVSMASTEWLVDRTAPSLKESPAGGRIKTRTTISYSLVPRTDASGVDAVEYRTAKAIPTLGAKPVSKYVVAYSLPVTIRTTSTIYWLRVRDAAGNWSAWYRAG